MIKIPWPKKQNQKKKEKRHQGLLPRHDSTQTISFLYAESSLLQLLAT